VAYSRRYLGISLVVLIRGPSDLTQVGRCPCRDTNLARPKYLSTALLLRHAVRLDNFIFPHRVCCPVGPIIFLPGVKVELEKIASNATLFDLQSYWDKHFSFGGSEYIFLYLLIRLL
jgi:hypothetical protein